MKAGERVQQLFETKALLVEQVSLVEETKRKVATLNQDNQELKGAIKRYKKIAQDVDEELRQYKAS